VRGLGVDDWQLDLQLIKHTEHFVKLGVNVWHVRTEGIFVRAAVVALETFVLAAGGCGWVASHTLTLMKASLSELSIARQLLKSSASFSCCGEVYGS
jgi:hypothetical protein